MKKYILISIVLLLSLMSFTPIDKSKVPIKNIQGLQDSLNSKPDTSEVNLIINNINPHDSVYFKPEVDSISRLSYKTISGGVTARITHTGTVAATTIHTQTFDSSMLSVNGIVAIEGLFDATTGDTYTKTWVIKINGTQVASTVAANNTFYPFSFKVINRNSNTAKLVILTTLNLPANENPVTATIDTSTGTVTITVECTLTNVGASAYLDYFNVQVKY